MNRVAVVALAAALVAQAPAKTLDIYCIDTEGGQATLFVSPTGQSVLVRGPTPQARH